ncbi:MAG: N-acetyltransferase family protein [Flavobacteriaceae bacterium]
MPTYREATKTDAENIALLHAANWQLNYRGILDDYYLDHQVEADRRKVWSERLSTPDNTMYIVLAEEEGMLIGFGCIFLEESETYGAYLDNLHVLADYSGRGIGKVLMSLLARKVIAKEGRNDMYLWVLRDNKGAIRLYEKLKGERKEQVTEKEIGNDPVEKIRYYWPDVSDLIVEESS